GLEGGLPEGDVPDQDPGQKGAALRVHREIEAGRGARAGRPLDPHPGPEGRATQPIPNMLLGTLAGVAPRGIAAGRERIAGVVRVGRALIDLVTHTPFLAPAVVADALRPSLVLDAV